MSASLKAQLERLPPGPGVYLMKDTAGNVLYVGKAASLHNRVRSYFAAPETLPPKTQRLVSRVRDLDFYLTTTETEALILELNLIKSHRPPYNVRLKDDKTFPYLKIDTTQEWPRIYVTRRLEENGGHYFGPFASAGSVRQTLKVIKEIFPFRTCSRQISGDAPRPCLNYYLHHCPGPCIGAVSRAEYAEVIRQITLFLEGKQTRVLREMENRMKAAARALDFERAARLRDQIEAVKRVISEHKTAVLVRGELDAVALAADINRACVQVFFIRGGKLMGRESFVLEGTRDETPSQVMTGFIKQFYNSAAHIPPLLLVQHPVEDEATIADWLSGKRGSPVELRVPRRGSRRHLMEVVADNARQGLEQLKIKQLAQSSQAAAALAELQKELNLPAPPARLEGYDISNIQGKLAVGSMVVFEDGRPKPAHYRRFRIKTGSGADDYSMMREVLGRRFRRLGEAAGSSWAVRPDLVLIDGGKGQLGAAMMAMAEAGADAVPVIGLAKENEEIFVPYRSAPLVLSRQSAGLKLLQHLRDEAHRFALSYHVRTRRQQATKSALDSVPGIGPRRRRALLRRFGSVRGLREANEAEISTVDGISPALAHKIKLYL